MNLMNLTSCIFPSSCFSMVCFITLLPVRAAPPSREYRLQQL